MSTTQPSPALPTGASRAQVSPAPRSTRNVTEHSTARFGMMAETAPGRRPWISIAVAWHLWSLDAPTVAIVWCWFLGAVFHVPYSRVTLPILGLGTWVVYVADRLLDGYSATETASLRERHWFYFRHRRVFTIACLTVAAPLTWMILRLAQPGVRLGDIALCILGIAYFSLVHGHRSQSGAHRSRWFLIPKELAVGFLFAVACTMPTWLRARHVPGLLLVDAIAFGALCSLNCVAIQTWEDEEAAQEVMHSILGASAGHPRIHPVTAFLGRHLKLWSAGLLVAGILGAWRAPGVPMALPWAAIAASAAIFLVLLHWRERLPAQALRIAADAALLTPLLLWPLVR